MGWKLPTLIVSVGCVALVVAGVAIGLVAHGPAGALAGAVPGAVAGVIAGFVPGFRDAAQQRRDERARAEAAWDSVGELVADQGPIGPAGLLRADRAVVEFTGRAEELAALRAWCCSDTPRSIRLLVGAGGVGKTRTALKIAGEWEAGGGAWRLVSPGEEHRAVAAARGVTSGRVLLIVDYAEGRPELDGLFRAVAADPGPIRVLLLARSLGEWWDRIAEASPVAVRRLLAGVGILHLGTPLAEDVSDAELLVAALPFFADALHRPRLEQLTFTLPTERLPVIVLHAAALIAVLRFSADPAMPLRLVVGGEVLDELVQHEAAYWRRSANSAGLTDDGPVVKSVVAAAVLLGAESAADAAAVVTRVPSLADISQEMKRRWSRWLYGLYPAEEDGRLGSLQPDLLAERHVVSQLTADPELARACLRDLSGRQAERALTILARACAHQDQARPIIASALRDNLADLGLAAVHVAQQTRADLGDQLAEALAGTAAPLQVLRTIASELPYPNTALAQAGLTATLQVRSSLPPGTEPADRAEWDYRAGLLLSQVGRLAEAESMFGTAVTAYRRLANEPSGGHSADLAASLASLGALLAETGRPAEALPVTEEAVRIRRELATATPGRYREELADSMANLGVLLSRLGRPTALAVTQEALGIRRELAEAEPIPYRADLAASLCNFGALLGELGRSTEALAATEEAIEIYREFSGILPDRIRPDLALALMNLSGRLTEAGQPAQALTSIQEAVTLFRKLAAALPERYKTILSKTLFDLSELLSTLGQPAAALRAAEEAVEIYRELAQTAPARYRRVLAASLANLGIWLAKLGRPEDALQPAQEAVDRYRELQKTEPGRYIGEFVSALTNLGAIYAEAGQPDNALPIAQEAVQVCRKPADTEPRRYQREFVGSLINLAAMLSAAGRPEDALAPAREAVEICRAQSEGSTGEVTSVFAAALTNLSTTLSMLGRNTEAGDTGKEAAQAYQRLRGILSAESE